MPLKILILGAGVAGPALATMLLSSSSSYTITVVERTSALRTGGQQIDLRAQSIPIVKRMGLQSAIKSRCVGEKGIAFVNSRGRIKALVGQNDTGKGPQGLTSEYEIMRGDLVDVLYQAGLEAARKVGKGNEEEPLKYEFGKYATEIDQHGNVVDVTFSDGTSGKFDLVVGADGQGSRTRRMVFGKETSEAAFHSLGVYSAFFSIPRELKKEEDEFIVKLYHVPGRRMVFTRTGNRPVAQAYLSTMAHSEKMTEAMAKGVEEQKAGWEGLFRGAGWQTDRILDGMKTTDDFYSHVAGQVKMEKWHKGRVVLLGDAGYCPSPNTGMGTTSALVGCYVLAGELATHGKDIDAALHGYEGVLRPFVNEAQKLPPGVPRIMFCDTQWGIWIMHVILATFTVLRIDKLLYRLLPEDKGGWQVPDYPKLKLQG